MELFGIRSDMSSQEIQEFLPSHRAPQDAFVRGSLSLLRWEDSHLKPNSGSRFMQTEISNDEGWQPILRRRLRA